MSCSGGLGSRSSHLPTVLRPTYFTVHHPQVQPPVITRATVRAIISTFGEFCVDWWASLTEKLPRINHYIVGFRMVYSVCALLVITLVIGLSARISQK